MMLDAFTLADTCYSLGVGPDVSWDYFFAELGMEIHQFDHTVLGPPQEHQNFRFNRVGITHDEDVHPGMKTIKHILEERGHQDKQDMLLKVDIEGCEWDVLNHTDSDVFARFAQIVVEFHALQFLDSESFRDRTASVFEKLNVTHKVVHVHGNNYPSPPVHFVHGIPIPDCVEVTYALKRAFMFGKSSEVFPTALDYPNDPAADDLFLGSFRFV